MAKSLTHKQYLNLYKSLLLPRLIEEQMLLFLRKGKISKWFSGIGQEAISVGITSALKSNDVILPMHRNLGVFTTRNVDLETLFSQLMNKKDGFTKSRDRTFHFGCPDKHIIGMISHVAAMLPVANGYGFAFQINKEKRVAVAFVGDGATSEGDFHEALNLAAVWNLPVIFVIENNGYALSTPTNQQYACTNLIDRAVGYGMKSLSLDGNDLLDVYHQFGKIVKKTRNGEGPYLVEAKTFRMRGHEEASGVDYVPEKLINSWNKKDPVLRFETQLKSKKVIDENGIKKIKQNLLSTIIPILDKVSSKPESSSTENEEINDVYSPPGFKIKNPSKKKREIRYIDAIKECLDQKLEDDSSVLFYGQDIAEYGGVFKVSEGFLKKFGNDRIRNTPIIESGLVGMGLGVSLNGLKPVIEIQFADFITCAFNQIVNNLAKNYYRWGSSVNVTIRMPSGGGMGAGPFHSQNPEAWFCHVPGLKVVVPSNPMDAKGLLNSAIDDPNPVLFFEHKALYRSQIGEVPENLYHIELGKAKRVKEGDSLTIICYGLAVHWAIDAVDSLGEYEGRIEIIDLRTLIPWDKDLIRASVQKTGRVLILHEDHLTGGFGAEISAWISEHCFEYLDAPVTRLGSLDTPIPANEKIEKDVFWPKNQIHSSLTQSLNY